MVASPTSQSDRVRALNDELRQRGVGGTIVATPGVRSRGSATLTLIIDAVAEFHGFTADNDPYGEHDFGAVEVQGLTVFFKIEGYDRDLRYQSPVPADPFVTRRFMTLMLAEEY
jgi:hypothetical protein